MRRAKYSFALLLVTCLSQTYVHGQSEKHSFFAPSDTFNKARFWTATGSIAAVYTGTLIGLNEIWYKQYPRSSFSFKDDWGEWENVDKAGHLFTTYMYASWMASIARWTGIESSTADWIGVGTSMLFQTSIEVLDGFSSGWGFSWSDMAFNAFGAGAYIGQQALWGEQRIVFKFSSTPVSHPDFVVMSLDGESSMTLNERANDLFGNGFFEQLLKDYNAQTLWVSANIHSFLGKGSRFPKWLNVAAGYGAFNMYGGYENTWEKDGATFVLEDGDYSRYRQYFLSLDVDFTRIPTRSPFLRTLFGMLNVFKVPFPAVEFNSVDKVKFHAIKF